MTPEHRQPEGLWSHSGSVRGVGLNVFGGLIAGEETILKTAGVQIHLHPHRVRPDGGVCMVADRATIPEELDTGGSHSDPLRFG